MIGLHYHRHHQLQGLLARFDLWVRPIDLWLTSLYSSSRVVSP
jgi:hypothetical protein